MLATLFTSLAWTPDSRSIVTVLLPEDRGAPPVKPAVPTAPQVRVTTPEKNTIGNAGLALGPNPPYSIN